MAQTSSEADMLEQWNKVHLLGVLSASLGLRSYLEITSIVTGGKYREARELSFSPCMRLVYRLGGAPAPDGLPVDFGSDTDNIEAALAEIRAKDLRFDLVFLDAFHTWECAERDISAAYSLLNEDGVLVLHDCNPPNRETATPEFHYGEWCGVTYKSYVDFCLGNPDIDYLTLDADYGCGIIMKPRSPLREAMNRARARRQDELKARWAVATTEFDTAFTMFDEHRAALLRLVDFGGLRDALSDSR